MSAASTARARALFLHGVPTAGRLWDGVRARLPIPSDAPDLPGFGGRAALADPTVEALARPLLASVDAHTHLVGTDLGGLLAAWIATQVPVASLTLSSTVLGLAWLPSRLTAIWPLNRYFYRRFGGRRWLAMGVSEHRRAELLAQYPGAAPEIMEPIARRLPLRSPLPKVPTLCLWGAADVSFPAVQGRLLARRLDASWVSLPGLRHYAMWEDPAAYSEALLGFWAQVNPPRSPPAPG